MRSRRLSFVAGWAAVALLAVAGFAAFGTPDGTDDVQAEAAANSIGHTAGAYAGLSFALVGDGETTAVAITSSDAEATDSVETTDTVENTTDQEDTRDQLSSGTIASPNTGWLSEVEVRSLVETYFEPTDVNQAVRIAWCESRFDPNSVDAESGGTGLFSHLPQYWDERSSNAGFPGVSPTDAEANVAAAAWEVYDGAGWEVFGCR